MKKALISTVAIIVLFTMGTYYARADIFGSSLLAWYSFDSRYVVGTVVTDNSGFGNTGTIFGTPINGTAIMAQGLLFNAGSYMNSGNITTTNFGTNPFTLSAWVKTTTDGQYFLSKRGFCSHENFWDMAVSSNKVVAEVDQDGGGTNYNAVGGTKTVTDGKWHLVTVTRTGAAMSAYTDGAFNATVSGPGTANLNNTNNVYTGGNNPCVTTYSGALDDVRIYSRALSAAEIQTLYYAGISQHENGNF